METTINSGRFFKRTLLIAVPVMIQNLITNFVALIDNIMVGQIGTEQMSGVAIVNQLFFVYNLTIFGALSGAGIFCAQFFGKNDMEGVKSTFRYKTIASVAIMLIGILIFVIFGGNLITAYLHTAEEGIDLELTFGFAKQYMAIMLIGLIPFTVEQVYSGTLREGGTATVPMAAGIAAVLVNTTLNYLLIFGSFGFPKLGVEGAAIATVISRFVQAGIVIIWTHANSRKVTFIKGVYRSLKVPRKLAGRITVKGLIPLTANECLWGAGVSMLVQLYSIRGIDVVAGLNIANTVINLFNVMFIAFGSGVSVVIGQLLGAGEMEQAKQAAPRLIAFSGGMCVVVGGVMAAFSGLFPLAYNTSDNVRGLATMFIIISAVLMPVHGALHSTYFTIRSGGKTLITFLFDCVFSWALVVPTVAVLAYFTVLPIMWLYMIGQGLEIIKCVIGLILVKKGIWLSNIVSDNN